ncbi:tetratricopeptide repeat-containing sensor histidine kinase [Cytophagales bacterium LB-30]|uniref:histidine kinase n=1 Tax=Shiella aurantiaca TaxID=3058365 RepID=A0ABT8F0S6_9BACT|nr:tetratricopeptide repeat-containing sensor histidine kinase [Shiella aurantiaca]MDN4164027.1 tetratricopeptide repeat-containing sensor histidine kinase [Shiella aurantiaca]
MSPKVICFLALGVSLFFGNPVKGQEKALLEQLKNEKRDSLRMDIFFQLANTQWNSDYEKGKQYADSARALSLKTRNKQAMLQVFVNEGIYSYGVGNYSDAASYYDSALVLARQMALPEKEIYVSLLKGNLHNNAGFHNKALQVVDNLENRLSLTSDEEASVLSIRARAYYELNQLEEAEKSIVRAVAIRDSLGISLVNPNGYFTLAQVAAKRGEYEKAIRIGQKMLRLSDSTNQLISVAYAHMLLGDVFTTWGKFDSARVYYQESLQVYEKQNVPQGIAELKVKLADLFLEGSDYKRAIDFLVEAIKLAQLHSLDNILADAYLEFAYLYKEQGNIYLAKNYNKKAADLYTIQNRPLGLAQADNTLGLLYLQQSQYDSARYFLEKALAVRESAGDVAGLAASMYNLALVFEEEANWEEALVRHQKSLTIEKSLGNEAGIAISYNSIAHVLNKTGKPKEAIMLLAKAEEINKRIKSFRSLLYTYQYLSESYDLMGDYKKSLDFYKKYSYLSDSLFSEQQIKYQRDIEASLSLANKDREISLLQLESEKNANELVLREEVIDNQRNVLILSMVIIFILIWLSLIIARNSRERKKSNEELKRLNYDIYEQKEEMQTQSEELKEANERVLTIMNNLEETVKKRTQELEQAYHELDTFFYRSSHDFRRPVTTFLGIAEVATISVSNPEALMLFDKVKETATHLDAMLKKLQFISEIGSEDAELYQFSISNLITEIIAYQQKNGNFGNINVHIQAQDELPLLTSYPSILRIALSMILENVADYSHSTNPMCSISVDYTPQEFIITIKDNGQGIPEEYHKEVFDMYVRANESSKGNGLGLYIVKRAIMRLQGRIQLESTLGQGTTITLSFPDLSTKKTNYEPKREI